MENTTIVNGAGKKSISKAGSVSSRRSSRRPRRTMIARSCKSGSPSSAGWRRSDPRWWCHRDRGEGAKDRVDDAMHRDPARRSKKAILPGGGVALLRASEAPSRGSGPRTTTRRPASRCPQGLVLAGAPDRPECRREWLDRGRQIIENDTYGFGFDAQSGEYVNMISKASSIRPRWCVRPCRARPRLRPAHHHRGPGLRNCRTRRRPQCLAAVAWTACGF